MQSRRNIVYHVNSRFASRPTDTTTNFVYTLPALAKRVSAVTVSSVEISNLHYNVSALRGSNTLDLIIGGDTIHIVFPDGNYDVEQIITTFDTQVDTEPGDWSLTFNEITGKFTLSETNGVEFTIQTSDDTGCKAPRTTLGLLMGFAKQTYSGTSSYTSDTIVNTFGDTSVFLRINDYEIVYSSKELSTGAGYIAKIVLDSPKFTVVFDNFNFITKTYSPPSLINIPNLHVRLENELGEPVDLGGRDFSFTVEIEQEA